jgi:hypothetical protein
MAPKAVARFNFDDRRSSRVKLQHARIANAKALAVYDAFERCTYQFVNAGAVEVLQYLAAMKPGQSRDVRLRCGTKSHDTPLPISPPVDA